MEILLQIIEEEVDSACEQFLLEQYDDDSSGESKGLKRIIDRSNTVGMFLSPITDIWNAIKFRAGEFAIKGARTVSELIGSTFAAILPFNDPKAIDTINQKMGDWEDEALSVLDHEFAKERKELGQGWETFKTDFWGIGFVASPMNAIAGLAVGGKALDAAFSVLDVATRGSAGRLVDLLSGERARRSRYYEAVERETAKPKFKDLPEDEKKKVFDELMKNPEIVKAAEQWSTENLPKVMSSIVGNMNRTIADNAKSGRITPAELAKYKAMAPNFTKTLFDKIKGKSKKFKIQPPPAALAAASKAVEAQIKSMPVLPAAQPQQVPAQVPQQAPAQVPQQVPAQVPQQAPVSAQPVAQAPQPKR
jgi:hypothetical protein